MAGLIAKAALLNLWITVSHFPVSNRCWLNWTEGQDMNTPTAQRLVRVRWRDGRLWLGVALIIVSMVIGSRLISHSDDRVTVWRATRDLSVGSAPLDLEPVAVALGDSVAGYVRANENPSGVLLHSVAAGELLPSNALGALTGEPGRAITLAVEPLHAPVGLLPGDRVDVWATPVDASVSGASRLVEASALVVAVTADSLGVGGEIGVGIEIPEAHVGEVIAAVRGGVVDLVTVPLEVQP